MNTCTSKELQFAIFLIHHLAKSWSISTAQVYKILNDTDILDGYILKNYDCLHTLGVNYLVEDISEFVREKGVNI